MKFKLIKPNLKNVAAYGHSDISTGDSIELTGHLAEKAKNNPDFEVQNGNKSGSKKQSVKKAKSARGRGNTNK